MKAPSETNLQTNSAFYSVSSKVWNGKAWKIWPDFHFYALGSCCPPCFTGLVDRKRKARVNRQLSPTPQRDQLFPAQAVRSLVQSWHTGPSNAAGGERVPLSQPIWFGNLLGRAASTSSPFASAVVAMARNPKEPFSPPQSSLNLLPPTSSAQLSSRSQSRTYQCRPKYKQQEILPMNGECRNHPSTASSRDRFHPLLFQTPSFIPPLACFGFVFFPPYDVLYRFEEGWLQEADVAILRLRSILDKQMYEGFLIVWLSCVDYMFATGFSLFSTSWSALGLHVLF